MGRRPSTVERSTLSVRVDQELKDRLSAAALHLQKRPTRPSDVNISDFMRDVLTDWVTQYEGGVPGGREALADAYKQAQIREVHEQMERLTNP